MTRDEAFEKLEQTVGIYLMSGNADNTYCREWREILETLKEEPKTGHWIEGKWTDDDLRYNTTSYKCSNCGHREDYPQMYCVCGAKMESEE